MSGSRTPGAMKVLVADDEPSIPPVVGDGNRLTQIFLNLSRNAIQAMGDEGGRLKVTTRMSLNHRVAGPEGRPVPTVEVSFEDDGPGIPDEILDRLATPFFTTRSEGTGLGLAVSQHWVTRHGGRLQIENIVDDGENDSKNAPIASLGVRVRVDLPLRAHPLEEAAARR